MLRGAVRGATAVAVMALAQVVAAPQGRTPEERAREVVELLVAGKYGAVQQMFSQEMKDALPVGTLMSTVAPETKVRGKYQETGKASVQRMGEHTVVLMPAYFEKGALDFTISFNGSGQISGLYLKPGQKPKAAPAAAQKPAQTPEERAREAVGWLMAEKYESLYEASTAEMQKAASVEVWRNKVGPSVKALGKLLETGKASISQAGGYTVVALPARFETAWWDFTVSVNDSGQIGGLYMKPGEAPKTTSAPTAAPAAAQAVKAPEERAREVVGLLVAEKYESLYEMSTPEVQKALPLEAWRTRVGPSLKALGKLLETGQPNMSKAGAYTVVVLPAKFETASIDFTITLNDAGQIGGLFMRPAQTPASDYQRPAYSKPETFTEREVTVGTGEWKLPGTLTLPKVQGPVAGVVLVHGSGPNDRDETILKNRPFRDLAEGLASQGIAVLRYDKRTKVYGAKMVAMRDLTVQQETVEDAVLAAAVLRSQSEVDPRRVFILGHSLGGCVLPMILEQDPKAAGGIVLAGSTRPLEDLVLEQVEYLVPIQTAGQSEEVKQEGQKQLEQIRREVAAIRALQPGQEDGPMLFHAYPHYWLALRGYNPPAVAATLHMPLLILQGERDYQVSMVDFANWKAALGGRQDVTLKSYRELNHLFVEGTGKSTPAEYTQARHVAAEPVNDIARWVAAH